MEAEFKDTGKWKMQLTQSDAIDDFFQKENKGKMGDRKIFGWDMWKKGLLPFIFIKSSF